MSQCQKKNQADSLIGLVNKEPDFFSDIHEIDKINFDIAKIGSEILRITLIVKQRNIKDINKNFQATLTNYFLECYVCTLLLKHLGLQYKREVKKMVESNLTKRQSQQQNCNEIQSPVNQNDQQVMNKNYSQEIQSIENKVITDKIISKKENNCKTNKKLAKYILLIKVYEEQINVHQLREQYIDMLVEKINEKIDCFSKDSQKYITEYQKKLCAVLLLQHFLQTTKGNEINSFCELWNSVFFSLPLYYFARENNIFYNKVKMGEESSQEYLNQILSSAELKIKIQENLQDQQIKTNFNQSKNQKKSIKIANYKNIEQKPPNINLNYFQIANQYYQQQISYEKCQNRNEFLKSILKLEENQKIEYTTIDKDEFQMTANQIKVINMLGQSQPKIKKGNQKNKQNIVDQNMDLPVKKMKILSHNESFSSNQQQKFQNGLQQDSSFQDMQSSTLKNQLNNDLSIEIYEKNIIDNKNTKKQVKYRFI
ncbi:hypothetical protein ABPG72_004834 [Tetrahymena utriculariae]